MTGLLPLAYTLSSLDAFMRYKTLNVQAGCRFADEEFNQEVQSGNIKSSSLERFSCVALAGMSNLSAVHVPEKMAAALCSADEEL